VYSFTIATDTSPVAQGTGGAAVTFNASPTSRTFSYFYNKLDLAGDLNALPSPTYQKDYTVTVNAHIDSTSSTHTNSADHTLTIKNPCIDEDYLDVTVPATVPDFTYTLYNNTDQTWTHPAFTIVEGQPGVAALCGASTYSTSGDDPVNTV
jgi:hypothetical protein